MKTNKLTLSFCATECNGFPSIKIVLDDTTVLDYTFVSQDFQFTVTIDQLLKNQILKVIRYNKTDKNTKVDSSGKIVSDQLVEITDIQVDNIVIPNYLLNKQSRFEFDDQTHIGSRFFSPNGVWTFEFITPMITYILDQKIIHEAQYNQDYQYPWSYKLGPDSVTTISKNIKLAQDQISKL